MTWADADLAFAALRQWFDFVKALMIRHQWELADVTFSYVLVADASLKRDANAGNLGSSQLASRIWRLGVEDHDSHQRWYQRISRMVYGGDRSGFLTEEETKVFDEAIVLATEGRMLFSTKELRQLEEWPEGVFDEGLGLGPGSTGVGDEVRFLPGGRNHIVLRPLSLGAVFEKVPDVHSFSVVGDCFFLRSRAHRFSGTWFPEKPTYSDVWLGGLPEDLLRYVPAGHRFMEDEPERIYIF